MKSNQQREVDGPQPGANFFVLTMEANKTPAGLFLRPGGRIFLTTVVWLIHFSPSLSGMQFWRAVMGYRFLVVG